MILPIVAYGHPVLKKVAADFEPDDPQLPKLIDDMFETMYASSGVGLAGPQVNVPGRIFVIDASPFAEEDPLTKDFKKVFINAEILEQKGEMLPFNEGCLSFPGLREDVIRPAVIRIRYLDANLQERDEEYGGILSRIIQHEYDHIEGIVFVDRISKLRRTLIKGKLSDISRGMVDADYRMLFPSRKRNA